MIKYIGVAPLIFILFIVPALSWANIDTLQIMSSDGNVTSRTAYFELKVNQSKVEALSETPSKALTGTLNISTKEDSIGILLKSVIVAKDTLFFMQDSSRNALDRIYSLLGCEEVDLKTKYFSNDSRYGNIVFNHLINKIFQLPKHQLSLVIKPIIKEENSTFFTNDILWIIIGILGIIIIGLTLLYFMSKKSTPPTSDIKLLRAKLKTIKAELQGEREEDGIEKLSDADTIESLSQIYFKFMDLNKDYNELKVELENTRQSYQTTLAENNKESLEDRQFFRLISETYIKPFVLHFRDDTPYPADIETQRKLIENLIPLAFHFMSFVKLKNKEGVEYDKLNFQQLQNAEFFSPLLKTIDFSANVSNTDNKLVLHIIDLLKKYHVEDLKKVNINGYIIKNDTLDA